MQIQNLHGNDRGPRRCEVVEYISVKYTVSGHIVNGHGTRMRTLLESILLRPQLPGSWSTNYLSALESLLRKESSLIIRSWHIGVYEACIERLAQSPMRGLLFDLLWRGFLQRLKEGIVLRTTKDKI